MENNLAQFAKQNYLNLRTIRKSGQAVDTPVWFVEDQGLLYVHTGADSGKVKRIRNNSHVQVAPCNRVGGLLGEWVDAQARVIEEGATAQVDELFKQKYGLQKRLFDIAGKLNGYKSIKLAIRLSN